MLPAAFYLGADPVPIARALLGKVLCTRVDGALTSVILVETEAYAGENDRACHAHLGRREGRVKVLYAPGGRCYVYLCYGIHHLFNVVTDVEGRADAVLARAGEPLEGVDVMLRRRGRTRVDAALTMGPGSLTRALAIEKRHDASVLEGPELWIEDRGVTLRDDEIAAGPRVGVDYAGEDAALPWRFQVIGSPYVSRPRAR